MEIGICLLVFEAEVMCAFIVLQKWVKTQTIETFKIKWASDQAAGTDYEWMAEKLAVENKKRWMITLTSFIIGMWALLLLTGPLFLISAHLLDAYMSLYKEPPLYVWYPVIPTAIMAVIFCLTLCAQIIIIPRKCPTITTFDKWLRKIKEPHMEDWINYWNNKGEQK